MDGIHFDQIKNNVIKMERHKGNTNRLTRIHRIETFNCEGWGHAKVLFREETGILICVQNDVLYLAIWV